MSISIKSTTAGTYSAAYSVLVVIRSKRQGRTSCTGSMADCRIGRSAPGAYCRCREYSFTGHVLEPADPRGTGEGHGWRGSGCRHDDLGTDGFWGGDSGGWQWGFLIVGVWAPLRDSDLSRRFCAAFVGFVRTHFSVWGDADRCLGGLRGLAFCGAFSAPRSSVLSPFGKLGGSGIGYGRRSPLVGLLFRCGRFCRGRVAVGGGPVSLVGGRRGALR